MGSLEEEPLLWELDMAMTLTDWWTNLNTDLDALKVKLAVGDPEPAPWTAARLMITEGNNIEIFLGSLRTVGQASGQEAKIDKASEGLCPPDLAFVDEKTKKTEYLPVVTDNNSLLFAMAYYAHLLRFKEVTQGLAGSMVPLKDRDRVERNAERLREQILNHYSTHKEEVAAQFPQEAEQLKGMLKSVEAKLMGQLEEEAKQEGISGSLLEAKFEKKADTIRQIATYKRLQELLKTKGEEALQALEKSGPLSKKDSDLLKAWKKMVEDTDAKPGEKILRSFVAAGQLTTEIFNDTVGRLFMNIMSDTVARVIPETIKKRTSAAAEKASRAVADVAPDTNTERRKKALIQASVEKINTLAGQLTSTVQSNSINSEDFEKMEADEIMDLAEKVSLMGHIAEVNAGIDKLLKANIKEAPILLGLLKPIMIFFSKIFVRSGMSERVLLSLEMESMQQELESLKTSILEQKEIFSDQGGEEKLAEILTKNVTRKVHANKFFTQDSSVALEEKKEEEQQQVPSLFQRPK